MAEKPTNIPPVHPPTAVPTAPPTPSAPATDPKKGLDAGATPAQAVRLDRPLRYKAANAAEQKLMQNLQGNILKGHGRDNTWNIFFEFGPDVAKSRRVLRELGNYHVTSAYAQLLESERFKEAEKKGAQFKSGTFCGAFLSGAGYTHLGLAFTAPPNNAAFAPGMKDASSLTALRDPELAQWEGAFRKTIHGMVLLADDEVGQGSAAVAKIELLITQAGGHIHHTQIGKAIRNAMGNGLEHFGYVDGRSQPLMLVEDIEQESRDEGIAHWDPTFPLDIALVPDPLADDDAKLSFGSFFVFRKLEQNVRAFKTAEQELADRLGLTGNARARAGAFVVGRFEDGTPVAMSPDPKDAKEPRNDFDYSGDAAAARCPFHAHIRKTNPRGSGGFEQEPEERRHIMARRGITYEDTLRVIHPEALPETNTTQEFLANVQHHLPETGVGLLFMAYNAKLDDQFVFTQATWANNTGFPKSPKPPVGIDGVIGQGPNAANCHAYPKEWDNPAAGTSVYDFKTFVKMKGGEYFFAPSVRFLRNI